jgi:phosphocarrier protein HPr
MTMPYVVKSILLTNAIGLHARPSTKLTQLAKTFASSVEIAVAVEGPWVDAKSPVKVMRVRVPQGALLHIRAKGIDAKAAVGAMVALVESQFHEGHAEASSGQGHG